MSELQVVTAPVARADAAARQALQHALLTWFARYGRDLPWRRTRDPYAILVSEVMLQQTQVDRVLPKYTEFLAQFPTLEVLAAAPTATVIQAWAGLGYNRRAVNLQRTAQAVRAAHGGVFPREVAVLRQLPGIGDYTAGAVACFAFEHDVVFFDTNIRRVLRRVLLGEDTAGTAAGDRALRPLAAALLPPGQGWAWNQGIMEVGALLCRTSKPLCWQCPLRSHCAAFAARRTADETVFSQYADPPATPPRRVAERKEAPFVGSNRYYRGRVVAALRALPAGAGLAADVLVRAVKPDYDAAHEQTWWQQVLAGLVRDGLIEWANDGTVRLPGGQADLPA